MKLSNRANLPDALVQAIANDPYSRGDSDFSITQLLKPPRMTALEGVYKDKIQEDAEDRLWSLYGQIAHLILERANRKGFAEKRLFIDVAGYRVSGQLDTLDIESETLSDWKFTTAYKFKTNQPAPEEWVAQLNMQLELLRQNGMDAKALQIVGLLRDFSKLEALRNPDYPQASVIIMPIPMWEREKTQAYMRERVLLHVQAGLVLPDCSPEERWERPSVFALMKHGRKTAVKLYDNEADAQAHRASDPNQLYVVHRKGQSVRCENYCSVSKFCSFAQSSKQPAAELSQEENVS